VAVVLVTGQNALRVVDDCCSLKSIRRIAHAPIDRILLATWEGPSGEELIVCRRSDVAVEIHCHGGTAAVRAVIVSLQQSGCQLITWREWLSQSELDPIRAAAQIALAGAPTMRTATILLDQYQGTLRAAVQQIVEDAAAGDCTTAARKLAELLAYRGIGLHLTSPWHVVIAGPPNVGKSSLLNALVGYERAIVCDIPGTTRDVVGATTAIDGWPIQFSDTAGMRNSADELELAGIERAAAAIAGAELVILVEEATHFLEHSGSPDSASITDILNRVPPATPLIRILSKIDLLPIESKPSWGSEPVATSALTGQGIQDLLNVISRTLIPFPPPPGTAIPFTSAQVTQLEAALHAAQRCDPTAIAASLRPLLPCN
jgi:tRNA modification GTPase